MRYNDIIKFFDDNNLPLSIEQKELIETKSKRPVKVKVKRTRSSPEWDNYRRNCIVDGIKPMSFEKWNNIKTEKEPEDMSRWNGARTAPTLWDKINKDPVFEETLRIRTGSQFDPTMSNR